MKLAAVLIVMLAAAQGTARPTQPNACDVLTTADIAAVQGEELANAKHSVRGTTSQCFYQVPSIVNSISVDLIREGREYWNEHFESAEREEREAREKEEEGEEEHPPKKVRGVGNEAFWVGGPLTGSLYVRKGDAVLRVSVGGKGSDEEKMEKSKALAKKALKRM